MIISAYIDRIEEDKAVILLGDDMKKMNFPAAYLPDDIGEGDYVTIEIKPDADKGGDAAEEALALFKATK